MIRYCLIFILSFTSLACSHFNTNGDIYKSASEYSRSKEYKPGRFVIIQGPTSANESNINILTPVLKKYNYSVVDEAGKTYDTELYETVHTPPLHWKIDKIYIKGLQPGAKYTLKIIDEFRNSKTIVDQRKFQTLDTSKKFVRFAYASCMADDYRFDEIINPMWEQMKNQNPELVILNGDLVYVDSFDFVERQKATELDVWFRFIDAFNRLPIYHWTELKPILATWDDHDFGTNDGDRNFKEKQSTRKIFLAFFGGKNIDTTYKLENDSVYFSFTGFGQKFLFLDDRYFRQPNKEQQTQEKFGHWGEKQHHWLISNLNDKSTPAWIFNGNQIFSGNDLNFKESMQTNHPAHFKEFMNDLKQTASASIFASGDIHFSEIMQIPAETAGFQTYEVSSSSMHSFTGDGWDNPLRVNGAFNKEFNFLMVQSTNENGGLKIDVESWGLKDSPYFNKHLEVRK